MKQRNLQQDGPCRLDGGGDAAHPGLDDAARNWIEKTAASLSTREKLGQLMIPRLTAAALKSYGNSAQRFIEEQQPGGCYIFGGAAAEDDAMMAGANEASEIPLLICADVERGIGQRIEGGTEFPGQLALGACHDEDLAYRFGEALAVEGRAGGLNWAFGPVVDVSMHPGNLSYIRCLSGDPEKVARLAVAIIRGMQDHGMAATAKHFPGGGVEDLDAHLTTSINPASREQWFHTSGLPFKAAIDAGVWSIMSSPIACPGIDPECGDPLFPRPVMTSRAACTDLLRGEWGFEGLLVTDAVNMGGLTMHYRRLEKHLACLNAGNDMLLFVSRLDSVYEYLEQALDEGRLQQERLDEAVRRVLTLKARLRLHERRPTAATGDERYTVLPGTSYAADAAKVAGQAITLIRDRNNTVPLPDKPGLRIASILITNRTDFSLGPFEDTLRAKGCRVDGICNPALGSLYRRIEDGEWDRLMVSLYYQPQWGWSTGRCHGPESRAFMDGFPFANPDVPPVFISWASPYHLHEFAFMDPLLHTYGGCEGAQQAAAAALLGHQPIRGVSPVAHPPFFKMGDGIQREARMNHPGNDA